MKFRIYKPLWLQRLVGRVIPSHHSAHPASAGATGSIVELDEIIAALRLVIKLDAQTLSDGRVFVQERCECPCNCLWQYGPYENSYTAQVDAIVRQADIQTWCEMLLHTRHVHVLRLED